MPLRAYGPGNPPPVARWVELIEHGLAMGLHVDAAKAYATLGWWGEHHGLKTPAIHSGARSYERQRQLQRDWDEGRRSGLVVRPATDSPHVRRIGWDLERCGHFEVYAAWGKLIGVRWGGNFQNHQRDDVVHFDLAGR